MPDVQIHNAMLYKISENEINLHLYISAALLKAVQPSLKWKLNNAIKLYCEEHLRIAVSLAAAEFWASSETMSIETLPFLATVAADNICNQARVSNLGTHENEKKK